MSAVEEQGKLLVASNRGLVGILQRLVSSDERLVASEQGAADFLRWLLDRDGRPGSVTLSAGFS
jgi:hypothetical protein